MNVIRLKEFYSENYNTYLGSWSKLITRLKPGSVCSYYNNLSSRPVGHSMQRSLKLKLQNALNQAFVDTGSPAIFVGGRRRNRKKRKNKNGQTKKKTKKGGLAPQPLSKAPETSYYEDVIVPYKEPKVSCLDIKEPVFAEHPIKLRLKDADRDSMYNSSDSLSSFKSDRTFVHERDTVQQTATHRQELLNNATQKAGLPRLHSKDSGVYDDDDVDDDVDDDDDDVGFYDDTRAERDEDIACNQPDIQDEQLGARADDNDSEDEDTFSLVAINDLDLTDTAKEADNIEELITETSTPIKVTDEFETAILEAVEIRTPIETDNIESFDDGFDDASGAVLQVNVTEEEENGLSEVKQLHGLEDADPFLKFVNSPNGDDEDDDEIVFDLSQLEVNNLDEISKTNEANAAEQFIEDQKVPTVLEDEIPLTVPLDLLIEEDDDEVLYEAGNRKELSITCNPLYEYTVKEEEDRLSIKSYQSGFKTNFDNVNFVQIPVPASDKAAHKSLKESTPLMKRQPVWGDRDDELACCIIL